MAKTWFIRQLAIASQDTMHLTNFNLLPRLKVELGSLTGKIINAKLRPYSLCMIRMKYYTSTTTKQPRTVMLSRNLAE